MAMTTTTRPLADYGAGEVPGFSEDAVVERDLRTLPADETMKVSAAWEETSSQVGDAKATLRAEGQSRSGEGD